MASNSTTFTISTGTYASGAPFTASGPNPPQAHNAASVSALLGRDGLVSVGMSATIGTSDATIDAMMVMVRDQLRSALAELREKDRAGRAFAALQSRAKEDQQP